MVRQSPCITGLLSCLAPRTDMDTVTGAAAGITAVEDIEVADTVAVVVAVDTGAAATAVDIIASGF